MKHIIQVPPVAEEWLYVPDVTYQTVHGLERCLQCIIPFQRQWPEGRKVPVVLFVPGSGWYRQEMYNGIPNHAQLARRGFAMADMQYRECTIAKFPAQADDVEAAAAFLPTLAEQFHLDMDNLFLMGDSSGAHTVLMAALTKNLPIRGVISYFAPTDMALLRPDGPKKDLLASPEDALAATCMTHVQASKPLPPILMFHGTHDGLVNAEHSRRLHAALEQTGHDVTYYEVEGEDHGGGTWWSEPILDIVEGFLRKHCR